MTKYLMFIMLCAGALVHSPGYAWNTKLPEDLGWGVNFRATAAGNSIDLVHFKRDGSLDETISLKQTVNPVSICGAAVAYSKSMPTDAVVQYVDFARQEVVYSYFRSTTAGWLTRTLTRKTASDTLTCAELQLLKTTNRSVLISIFEPETRSVELFRRAPDATWTSTNLGSTQVSLLASIGSNASNDFLIFANDTNAGLSEFNWRADGVMQQMVLPIVAENFGRFDFARYANDGLLRLVFVKPHRQTSRAITISVVDWLATTGNLLYQPEIHLNNASVGDFHAFHWQSEGAWTGIVGLLLNQPNAARMVRIMGNRHEVSQHKPSNNEQLSLISSRSCQALSPDLMHCAYANQSLTIPMQGQMILRNFLPENSYGLRTPSNSASQWPLP